MIDLHKSWEERFKTSFPDSIIDKEDIKTFIQEEIGIIVAQLTEREERINCLEKYILESLTFLQNS